MLAAIMARNLRISILCDLMFPSAPTYAWAGTYNLSANGNTYLGLGALGGIGKTEEKNDGTATGLSLTLSGVPLSQIAIAVDANYQGAQVKLWLACFDSTWALIDTYQFFGGIMDIMTVKDGADTATIALSAESRMIETQRARVRRYTHDDQQIDFPGDNGFQFVNTLQLLQLYWGNPNGPSTNLPGAVGQTTNLGSS